MPFVLLAASFLGDGPVLAQPTGLSVGHYQVVSSTRVGRTEFEYTLTADVENTGPAARVVSATVISTSADTVILDNALSFGDVPTSERRTSTDTFKIRQNRVQAFDPNALQWTIASLPDFAVSITEPAAGQLVNTFTVQVRGSANNPPSSVVVNGAIAAIAGNTFSASVTLHEGNNPVTAVAVDEAGATATATVQVTVDTTPPRVTIDSPRDGAVLSEPTVVVAGLINDIVVGTVGPEQAQVLINGRPASVANRTFVLRDVPLSEGANTITAFAWDPAGNTDTRSITVTRSSPVGPHIRVVSGDGQSGQIGALLPHPLIVKATDADGSPRPDKRVIFKVVQNDGVVSDGITTAQSLIVTTDAEGLAQVQFRLGTRAGMGNNQVSAKIVGFEGEAFFCASTSTSIPALVVLDGGNNQVGVIGQGLPKVFAVIVVDTGNNRLPDIPITFTVKEGGGTFGGQPALTVNSDSNGRATAAFTLGAVPGNDNNVVEASFPDNPGLPVTFVASGLLPGDPAETSVSGVVLDNSDVPVPGALCRLVGHPDAVLSDENGYFQIKPAPVGTTRLIVDGATVTRPGAWVWLQFDLVAIAGQDNTIGRPVRLMPMDLTHALFVDGTHGGTITLPEAPGFSLTIAPGSVTFPNGTTSGNISATIVHPDKMPDPPEFGQQPRFLITVQPANALFNPPAAMCIPNLDGLPPGQKTEMYSYDHDLGAFVAIGTGTTSEDGSVICTDPGVGVVKAGWHCGGNPASTGSAGTCPVCQKCEGNNCVADASQNGTSCDDHDPCTFEDECDNGTCRGKRITAIAVTLSSPDNFRITADPRMPRIQARASVSGISAQTAASLAIEWRVRIRYRACNVRDINVDLPNVAGGLQYEPLFPSIRGGTLTVQAVVIREGTECARGEATHEVLGTNPTRGTIEGALPGDTERRIACVESRFRQFTAAGYPLTRCEPDGRIGVGVMQVTDGPSDQAFWDWRQATAEGLAIWAQKQADAAGYAQRTRNRLNDQTIPLLTADQVRLEAIQRYNGGAYWTWNTTTRQWVAGGNGYVDLVLNCN